LTVEYGLWECVGWHQPLILVATGDDNGLECRLAERWSGGARFILGLRLWLRWDNGLFGLSSVAVSANDQILGFDVLFIGLHLS